MIKILFSKDYDMIKIGLHGASGRMGGEIIKLLQNNAEATLAKAYSIEPLGLGGEVETTSLDELFAKSDVVIDFSVAKGAKNLLEFALNLDAPKPLVIGTTGLDEEGEQLLDKLGEKTAVLWASNMSLGVAVLKHLVSIASGVLRDFDVEIVEMHHRNKIDAPSGTALTLAEAAASARNLVLEEVRTSGRDGLIGARSKDEIAVMSLRGGDVVGQHKVGFYNDGEFVELCHTATSRATFAKGALRAAVWLFDKKRGRYSIEDCLGLKN